MMKTIEWSQKYCVGHDRIDHEHQVFFDLIKNVERAELEGYATERVMRMLEEVRKYADFHFFSEENIMIDHGYPAYAEHHREHNLLLFNLEDKFYNFRAGKIPLSDVVEFMLEWFLVHTTGTDQKLASYLARHSPLT